MVSQVNLRREVIQHEIGHWVVARHHKIHADYIEISEDSRGCYGHCNLFIFPRFNKIDDAREMIEARIRTLMAGTAAQLIERKTCVWDNVMKVFNSNGADDYTKISEYISLVSGFSSENFMDHDNTNEVYSRLFSKYWGEVVEIIKKHENDIRALTRYVLLKKHNGCDPLKVSTNELVSEIEKPQGR